MVNNKFPSLKKHIVKYKDISFKFIDLMTSPENKKKADKLFHSKWVWIKRIETHCLDKQEVKKAILKHIPQLGLREAILKELRLK